MSNGMKSGSGEDPFEGVESARGDAEAADNRDNTTVQSEPIINDEPTDDDADNSGNSGVSGLPWKYSRSNAKDGRKMVQFFLQEETQIAEEGSQSELETQLDENVLAVDLRGRRIRSPLRNSLTTSPTDSESEATTQSKRFWL